MTIDIIKAKDIMRKLEWNDSMESGLTEIDIQHRKFVNIINILEDSLEQNNYKKKFRYLIDEIERFLIFHFDTEDRLFKEHDYDATEHQKEHEGYLIKIAGFKKLKPTKYTVIDILNYIKHHFYYHALHIDRAFADFVKNKS